MINKKKNQNYSQKINSRPIQVKKAEQSSYQCCSISFELIILLCISAVQQMQSAFNFVFISVCL